MLPVIIEVIISIIVIYFLLSTLISFVNELISMIFKSRAKLLKRALLHLFDEKSDDIDSFINKIYKTKHLKNLTSKFLFFNIGGDLPSYIHAKDFSTALLEKIKELDKDINPTKLEEYKLSVDKIGNPFLQKKIKEFIDEIYDEVDDKKNKIHALKRKIEDWFNAYMGNVSYIYKSQTKVIMFFISLFLSFSLNIDSLVLIEYFYENKDQREIMINYAQQIDENFANLNAEDTTYDALKSRRDEVLLEINSFDLPIGWSKGDFFSFKENSIINKTLESERVELSNKKENNIFFKFLGLFLTTIALTLGAPFWYQMMMNMLAIKDEIAKKE